MQGRAAASGELLHLRKKFESALSVFNISSNRRNIDEPLNFVEEDSLDPFAEISTLAAARATVETKLHDDPAVMKDLLAMLIQMVAEALVDPDQRNKKNSMAPRPPMGDRLNSTAVGRAAFSPLPVTSPVNSAGKHVSTWYRKGSIQQPSSTLHSQTSIYCTPQVAETRDVIFGRDEDDNKTINDYVILGQLGKGSYGKVKLAEKQSTGQVVAIKIIKMSKFGKNKVSVMQKLKQEIAVMKKVAHDNLVRLYEVMHDEGAEKMYLVMQYVPLGTIASSATVSVPPDLLRKYAIQIVKGLHALHRSNIFHRDVKPDNILLGEHDHVYLADFGVSVICSGDGVEGVEGTPAFMAPELCKAEKNVRGDLVDLWALGVTFYQLMYGKLPFWGDTYLQMTRRIVNEPVTFDDTSPNGSVVPADFKDVVQKLLEKDPQKRLRMQGLLESKWLKAPVSMKSVSPSNLVLPPVSHAAHHSPTNKHTLDLGMKLDLESLMDNSKLPPIQLDETEVTESIAACQVVQTPFSRATEEKKRRLFAAKATAALEHMSMSSVQSAEMFSAHSSAAYGGDHEFPLTSWNKR